MKDIKLKIIKGAAGEELEEKVNAFCSRFDSIFDIKYNTVLLSNGGLLVIAYIHYK